MKRRLISLGMVLPLVAVTLAAAEIEWEHEWHSSTLFLDAQPPVLADTFGHRSKYQHDAPSPLLLESDEVSGAWLTINDATAWNPADAGGTTLEFRMKVDYTAEGALYAAQVICYGVNGNQRIEVNFNEEGVGFFDQEKTYAMKTATFNTYRLTFTGTKTFLYVNDEPEPVLSTEARGDGWNLREVTFGDGGSVRVGGQTEWEFIRWSHQGMFPPE